MAVKVQLEINGELYYVVSVIKGQDEVNSFFNFHLAIHHDDQTKIEGVRLNQKAQLSIVDDVNKVTLTYLCEIVRRRSSVLTDQQSDSASKRTHIELRPVNWRTLNHQAVRVFEVGDDVNNDLNLYFPTTPTLDELTKLLNLAAFEIDQYAIELSAAASFADFNSDWWQNQLAFQLQETNAQLFSRLVWKMNSAFFYSASQASPAWLCVPNRCAVPSATTALTEKQLSSIVLDSVSENKNSHWYRDQLTQVGLMTAADDVLAMDFANAESHFKTVELTSTVPLSCDQVYQYSPERKKDESFTFLPISVEHRYDHRTGYHCLCKAVVSLNNRYFDLSLVDNAPEPFVVPIVATIHATSVSKVGERDEKLRFLVQYDFKKSAQTGPLRPSAWLYRLREESSLNGTGNYTPLPVGTKVVVVMLNGDREQAVISNTFVTHQKRKSL